MGEKVHFFFNFRSPYCYLAAQTVFERIEACDATIDWRPLGGWDGRSPPDRAKAKVPIARQDLARWAKRMNIPVVPPPTETDGTYAATASLYAERNGLLKPFVKAVMNAEWARGANIGQIPILLDIARQIGLDPDEMQSAIEAPENAETLGANWAFAQSLGVIGVPSFVVGDAIFWGNDRIDFLEDHLRPAD